MPVLSGFTLPTRFGSVFDHSRAPDRPTVCAWRGCAISVNSRFVARVVAADPEAEMYFAPSPHLGGYHLLEHTLVAR